MTDSESEISSVIERQKQVIRMLWGSVTQAALELGWIQTTLNKHLLMERRGRTLEKNARLLTDDLVRVGNVNREWLEIGEGEIIRRFENSQAKMNGDESEKLDTLVTTAEDEVTVQHGVNMLLFYNSEGRFYTSVAVEHDHKIRAVNADRLGPAERRLLGLEDK